MTGSHDHTKVLIVDDDEVDRHTVGRMLRQIPDQPYTALEAETADEGLDVCARQRPDCVVLDYNLPAMDGLAFLARLGDTSRHEPVPVVVLTGVGNEAVAVEAMKRGAQDYLVKNELVPDSLHRAIRSAIDRLALQLQIKRAKESLEQQNHRLADLYETAHQFVDNVSHEFRTPLAVIKEFASILSDGLAGPISDDQREYLGIIANRVDDLETMVNDMLDISKLESGLLGFYRAPCALNEIIDNVRPTLERKAAAAKVALEISVDHDLPPVYCDPDKIGRVIVNLTGNAVKFSREGQTVRVWARPDGDASAVLVGVTDEGAGISPDNLKRLFQRFRQFGDTVRASTKGFGLGLNIARDLVRLNFGEMNVQSELGQGSTFSFTIPIADPVKFISRYLARVTDFRSDTSFISLVRVNADATDECSSRGDIEPLLQHQIRRTDLIFRTGERQWLLVAPSNQPDLGSMVGRMQQSNEEANRNRPSGRLPALSVKVQGTWRIADGMEEFLQTFQQAFPVRAVVHV